MTIKLAVETRDDSVTTDTLRTNGSVPGVVYGPKQEPIQITIEDKALHQVRKEAGESTIIELTGLAQPVEVLIKDIDFNPVRQQVVHVDFYAIERGKDMTTAVPLEFIGEAPVEASRAGTVNRVLQDIEVTCRPSKLPSHIDVDLSALVGVEDKILVKDLVLPEGVKVEAEPEDPVAVVSAAKEEVDDEQTEAVDMAAVEVEQKGKEEDTAADSEKAE